MALTRRDFIADAAGLAGSLSLARVAIAAAAPKVVIIGGGAGGASVAAKLSAIGGFDITVVEPDKVYASCFGSNLFLGGFQPFEVLRHDYAGVAKRPGVRLAQDRAQTIDRDRKRVTLAGGETLGYDALVMAPGISLDYGSVPGWSLEAAERMPHGWRAGEQTRILKRQLDAVPDGGLIVVIPPPPPARCPPAPYERVCMMAHALKTTGRRRARIVIVDPKEKFSMQALFHQAWERHYPGMIEWMPPMIHAGIKSVDAHTMTVETDFETYRNASLVNVIPAQRAGRIAIDAGLTDASGYCPIDPFTMKSRMDRGVFVIGDAAMAGDMSRSASAANSQAEMVARVVTAELLGRDLPKPEYRAKCWTLLETGDSVFVSGRYRPTQDGIEQFESVISTLEDSGDQRLANGRDAARWHDAITREMFAHG